MWRIAKTTGQPLHPDLLFAYEYPHTISYALALRMRYDSYFELPKLPPMEIWDNTMEMEQWIDRECYPNREKSATLELEV